MIDVSVEKLGWRHVSVEKKNEVASYSGKDGYSGNNLYLV